jgi:hypothetical protein
LAMLAAEAGAGSASRRVEAEAERRRASGAAGGRDMAGAMPAAGSASCHGQAGVELTGRRGGRHWKRPLLSSRTLQTRIEVKKMRWLIFSKLSTSTAVESRGATVSFVLKQKQLLTQSSCWFHPFGWILTFAKAK